MDITLNNAPNSPEPVITHHDYRAGEHGLRQRQSFSTATIVMGADTITIFLPFGGRMTYTNKDTK